MEIQHFLHKHPLSWSSYQKQLSADRHCHVCHKPYWVMQPEDQWHYTCRNCNKFSICKSCSNLPTQITHPSLPHHHHHYPLTLKLLHDEPKSSASSIICGDCKFIRYSEAAYKCDQADCEFVIDTDCASLRTSRKPVDWIDRRIEHYTHMHVLERCRRSENYDFMGSSLRSCLACEIRLGDSICYGCSSCDVWIHESCVDFPRKINHPIHTMHPLHRADFTFSSRQKYLIHCGSCQEIIHGLPFICEEKDCHFNLHVECVDSSLRTIRLDVGFHPHELLYKPNVYSTYGGLKKCCICNAKIENYTESFVCPTCSRCFHFDCVPTPSNSKHRWHHHSLALAKTPQEFYCCVCETPIREGNHSYSCLPCNFFAHIQCVLSQEGRMPNLLPSLFAFESKDKQQETNMENEFAISGKLGKNHELRIQEDKCHHHLRLSERRYGIKWPCSICKIQLDYSPTYTCRICRIFEVHKRCGELPSILIHPFHPNHPLTLFPRVLHNRHAVCDICNHVFQGFNFFCRTCGFTIDIKCAHYPTREMYHQAGQESGNSEENRKRSHFSIFTAEEEHQLRLGIVDQTSASCAICRKRIIGKVYVCLKCDYFYHESCLDLPREVQEHPLHNQHLLRLMEFKIERFSSLQGIFQTISCYACGDELASLYGTYYQCQECPFYLHLECVNQEETTLSIKCHKHVLYPFWANNQGFLFDHKEPHLCDVCAEVCISVFYRCIECRLDFHVRCLGLPESSKHKWHIHGLTLKASMVDDDGTTNPNCSICETQWDPRGAVYSCKQCAYIAHAKCIASKDNTCSYKCLGCSFRLEIKGSSSRSSRKCLWGSRTLHNWTHKHMLVSCAKMQNTLSCSICTKRIYESEKEAYGCAQCDLYMHESCAKAGTPEGLTSQEASENLVRHFNENHAVTMTLPEIIQNPETHCCSFCDEKIENAAYRCDRCGIWMHKSCHEDPNLLVNPLIFRQHLTRLMQSVAVNKGSLCVLCIDAFDGLDSCLNRNELESNDLESCSTRTVAIS